MGGSDAFTCHISTVPMQLLLDQCRTRISSQGIYISCVYDKGKFANISLSEYKGKWVLLCFYPGDFTFV